jgi:hypothetical protein
MQSFFFSIYITPKHEFSFLSQIKPKIMSNLNPLSFSGTINGSNLVFTSNIAVNPTLSTMVWVDSVLKQQGPDYTISLDAVTKVNNVFTFVTAPNTSVTGICALNGAVPVFSFGAIGDGSTDDTTALQAALDSGAPQLVFEPGHTYKITDELTIAVPIDIDFRNATIKAGVTMNRMMTITSNDISLRNGTLDLNYNAKNGIEADGGAGLSNLRLTDINMENQYASASNLDGGLYLTAFNNVYVTGGIYTNINNAGISGPTDHSPALKFISCSYIWINNTEINNAGVGINSYDTQHLFASGVKMEGINNNGYYIQFQSTDIDISGGYVRNFKDAGVTCKIDSKYSTNEYETSLRVRGVEFNNTDAFVTANLTEAMRGIGLRMGSGLLVSDCVFINCGTAMSQTSGFDGCSFVGFHDNIIVNPRGGSAISVDDGDRFDIHHNTIYFSPPVTLASLTSTGTVATATTAAPHNLLNGASVTISGASTPGYNTASAVITVTSSTTFTYVVASGLTSPAAGTITATVAAISYVLRFNTVTNSSVTDNKIYGNSNIATALSINTSNAIVIRNNIITGVTSAYQNVSGSSTNVVQEQDGATLGQYVSYAGPSSSALASSPSVTVKSTDSSAAMNDYIGAYNFYSADTSSPGAGVRASVAVKASNSTASQHQYEFFLDGTLVTTIDHNGNVKALIGDVEVVTVGKGVIIASPNGSRWRLTVSNAGALVIAAA